jgi:4-amino-4-deoxy-L-arabinose transferase-like glycosyltransferase
VLNRVKALILKDRLFGVILLVALLIRLVYLWYYHSLPDWAQLTVDNNYHHNWALSIANGNVFGDTTYFRAPFYVYCLAILYAVFGASIWVGRLFGLAIGFASTAMTYALGRKAFGRNAGLTAAALQAICPVMIYFESELLLDPLFTLLVQITLYRILVWRERDTGKNIFLVGLIFGLAAITRPTILVIAPLIFFWIFMRRFDARQTMRQTALFVAGAVCLIGPIFIRNLVVAGDPVVIASQGGINWYISNNPSADGVSAVLPEPLGHNWRIKDIEYIAEKERGRRLKPGEVSDYWTSKANAWVSSHPSEFLRNFGKRLYYSLGPREISNNRDMKAFFAKIPILKVNPLIFPVIFTLAIFGFLTTLGRNRRAQDLFWFLVLFTLFSALFFVNSRFRLPAVPIYLLFAAGGLLLLWNSYRAKLLSGIIRTAMLAALLLIVSRQWIPFPVGAGNQSIISQALYYYAQGDFANALEYDREALRIDSTFPETNLNTGVCLLRMGRTDSAMVYFEREVRLHPDRAKAYINIASVRLVQGRLKEAESEVAGALELRPYDVTGNRVLIRALGRDSAVSNDSVYTACLKAVENTDTSLAVLNEAAGVMLQRGAPERAERFITQAINAVPPPIETDDGAFDVVFPNSPANYAHEKAFSYYLAGSAAGTQGLYGQTVRYSQMAIQEDSMLVDAYRNLIGACRAMGQYATADSVEREVRRRFARPNDSL